jgi:hypothetical protein
VSVKVRDYQQRSGARLHDLVRTKRVRRASRYHAIGAVDVLFGTARMALTADLHGWSERTVGRFDGTGKIFDVIAEVKSPV